MSSDSLAELEDKVAVITGAASGFGREFALICAEQGMKLVLADVDEAGLQETISLLPNSTELLTLRCDVSKADEVESLADKSYERFSQVHLLFNNAGVGVTGPSWTATLDDWQWVLGVNLMGVVHGVKSFVPKMLAQSEAAHIVNTASVAGLLSVPQSAPYCVSKHSVVTLSECLHHELAMTKAAIGVSVLCPAFVPTGIAESERNRPDHLSDGNSHPMATMAAQVMKDAVRKGKLSARDVAEQTLAAIKSKQFYILTHDNIKPAVEARTQHILGGLPPHNSMTV